MAIATPEASSLLTASSLQRVNSATEENWLRSAIVAFGPQSLNRDLPIDFSPFNSG